MVSNDDDTSDKRRMRNSRLRSSIIMMLSCYFFNANIDLLHLKQECFVSRCILFIMMSSHPFQRAHSCVYVNKYMNLTKKTK